MKLVDDSPLRVGWLPWQFAPGDVRLVVVVKATVDLPREGVASLAEEQAFVTGDELWDDDVERSVRYASDLALVKPRAETWITGTVRSREPVRALACEARVGDVEMGFDVIGDRWWEPGGSMTKPELFDEMELCWERCFGGPGFDANPLGRGVGPDPGDELGRIALPNVEEHKRLIRSVEDRPKSVGAWPIPASWRSRARRVGSAYGGSYLRSRWPYFAEDFQWKYFQAAPKRQWRNEYWRGDEPVELSNLHPEHRRIRCSLPGIKPRVFMHEEAGPNRSFGEVGLVLDTIAIDAGQGKAFLVWRGATPIQTERYEEIAHLYVTHEPLGQPRTRDAYYAAFAACLKAQLEREQGYEAAPAPPPTPGTRSASEPEKREAQAASPPAPSAEEVLEARRQEALEDGVPPSLVDVLYPSASDMPLPRSLAELRAELEANAAVAEELGQTELRDSLREDIAALDEKMAARAAAAPKVEPPPGLWTPQELRDEVQRRIDAGEPLTRMKLTGADLSLMDLSGQDLSGSLLVRADLSQANLDGATLDGAVLDEAAITDATLRGARLVGASLTLVDGSRADFTKATLTDARFERAMLDGTRFDNVDAEGVGIEECLCVGARFDGAVLVEAEMARSNFDEASFVGANLTDARLDGSSLRRANMDGIVADKLRASDGADLSEALLRYARLRGATFARSLCIGTKFTESDLSRASFAEARLEGAELLAVRARAASFTQANMAAASLAGADLLGARFEGADLRLADLSVANAYQAEFWQANVADIRLDGANVEGTKLA